MSNPIIQCSEKETVYAHGELEGLNETNGLINRATDREVIDSNLAKGTLRVDDEESTEGDSLVFQKDAIVTRHSLSANVNIVFKTLCSIATHFMFRSATSGSLRFGPRPPCLRGLMLHAR
jgi:hypothetical protein